MKRYAGRARIEIAPELMNEEFARRLMHAADYEFGLLAELIVQSISDALFESGMDVVLVPSHFAEVFRKRSAAVDGLNPFIAENFKRIDPREVLGGEA